MGWSWAGLRPAQVLLVGGSRTYGDKHAQVPNANASTVQASTAIGRGFDGHFALWAEPGTN